MAPWNIVFSGPALDYIDYDTRDHTYDDAVPRAYEVMEVLFNYKRTVEDFRRCGGKGSNPYGFPFVSECVGGGAFAGPCKDSARPVPCGDGSCQSDYVACLRAVSAGEAPGDAAGAAAWAGKERARAARAWARPGLPGPPEQQQQLSGSVVADESSLPASGPGEERLGEEEAVGPGAVAELRFAA